MACTNFTYKIGDNIQILYEYESDNYQITFATGAIATPPVVGDKYKINGQILDVLQVGATTITCNSYLDNEDTLITDIPTTGSLVKITGAGTTPITYTARTYTNLIDLTGYSVNIRILKAISNNPPPADILFETISTTFADPVNGKFLVEIDNTTTDNFPPGIAYLCIKFTTPSGFENSILENTQITMLPKTNV